MAADSSRIRKARLLLMAFAACGLNAISAPEQPSTLVVLSAGTAPDTVSTATPAPVPPPAATPKLGATELQDLVAAIALYPDPLLATLLPASAYPLEIVQAARFVRDTNNLPLVDQQPWDSNVKNLARFPEVLEKLNVDLAWTIQLGQAFVDQPMELMDAIQALRGKAQTSGALATTPQQVVVVTNAVVERIYEQQIVYVTNTIIEIRPANPQVIYVPYYNPAVVYVPAPVYVSPVAPLVTFGAGIAVGVAIANNCNWHYGGVWVGRGGVVVWGGGRYPYYPPPPGFRPPYYYPPPGYRPPPPGYRPPGYPPPASRLPAAALPGGRPESFPGRPGQAPSTGTPSTLPATGQRWQPDEGKRQGLGSSVSRESRGWGASSSAPATRPSTGQIPNRPAPGTLPSGNRPSIGATPSPAIGSGQAQNQPGRAMPSQPLSQRSPSQSLNRGGYNGSALAGVGNSAATRDFSSRGTASRGTAGAGAARAARR